MTLPTKGDRMDHLIDEVQSLRRERNEARAEADKLRKMLGMLEWAGAPDGEERACPACGEWEDQGHADDCWLEPELQAEVAAT